MLCCWTGALGLTLCAAPPRPRRVSVRFEISRESALGRERQSTGRESGRSPVFLVADWRFAVERPLPGVNAAKEYLRFMMEAEQFSAWLEGCAGYVSHPLRAYDAHPIWTSDPKHTAYRDGFKDMRPFGYAGPRGYAAAGVYNDYIIPNMVAEAASRSKLPKEAAERAQKRAERYYKV